MAHRKRDYQAEYRRRVARGLEYGLSRSQARGHPRHHEPYVARLAKVRPYDPLLEEGLKRIREGRSMARAANSIGVAPERLRSYVTRTGVGRKEHSRWRIGPDYRSREMLVYSDGKAVVVILPDYEEARLAGSYMGAVGRFLYSNDRDEVDPFIGKGVRAADGHFLPFEVRPNVLYRLAATEGASFEEVYRIVV